MTFFDHMILWAAGAVERGQPHATLRMPGLPPLSASWSDGPIEAALAERWRASPGHAALAEASALSEEGGGWVLRLRSLDGTDQVSFLRVEFELPSAGQRRLAGVGRLVLAAARTIGQI